MGSEINSGKYMTGYRDMTSPEITLRGAKQLYEEAGIGPEHVDLAEGHDLSLKTIFRRRRSPVYRCRWVP